MDARSLSSNRRSGPIVRKRGRRHFGVGVGVGVGGIGYTMHDMTQEKMTVTRL